MTLVSYKLLCLCFCFGFFCVSSNWNLHLCIGCYVVLLILKHVSLKHLIFLCISSCMLSSFLFCSVLPSSFNRNEWYSAKEASLWFLYEYMGWHFVCSFPYQREWVSSELKVTMRSCRGRFLTVIIFEGFLVSRVEMTRLNFKCENFSALLFSCQKMEVWASQSK